MTKILVIGATGMLGQALVREARKRDHRVVAVGSPRHPGDRPIDLAQPGAVAPLVRQELPDVMINAAAIVDLKRCEEAPELAQRINADAVHEMAEIAADLNIPLVQISTDHFFQGDGALAHDENHPITIRNEYARSKFDGERHALEHAKALVVRTNITGFRGQPGRPTFVEWALEALKKNQAIQGFTDFYTSTIDCRSFAAALYDLINGDATGLYHLAARDVVSKYDFLCQLRDALGVTTAIEPGLCPTEGVARATSLGLDSRRAFALLGYETSDSAGVVRNLLTASQQTVE